MNFFKELQRRNVYRVAIAYLVTAWLLAQVADLALAAFGAPSWVQKTLLLILALGFPIACLLAWAYELTPEGIQRSDRTLGADRPNAGGHRALDLVIIGLLVIAVVVLAADRFLLTGATDPAAPTRGSERPSVAILPFINRSALETDAFFVDGVHEDLLRQIATIGSIKTISRTSVLQYRESDKSAPEIAAELGVDSILEGGVQRAGNQVRINVQLIDARSDEYLWTESYRRKLSAENIFSIQNEIATAVADALQTALTPRERDELAEVPTRNIDALNAYFSGRRRMETRRPEELEKAATELKKAIALDPEFALAYVALADTYRLLNNYGDLPQEIADARGREAVDKALLLDDRLGEAYASLANLRRRSGDYEGAEQAFLRGIELNPNYAPLYQWYGEFLALDAGRPRDAVPISRMAVTLDPKSAIINADYGETLDAAGRFEEAIAQYRIAIEIDPDFRVAYSGLAYLLERLGRTAEAIETYRTAVELAREDPWPLFGITASLLNLGDQEQAIKFVERIRRIAPQSVPHMWALMLLELYRGNTGKAGAIAEQLLGTWPQQRHALMLMRNRDLGQNDAAAAEARYLEQYPELEHTSSLDDPADIEVAVDYACLLDQMGDDDRAKLILHASLGAIGDRARLGLVGYKVADVRAHTLLGNRRAALAALQAAVDEGWRLDWWLELERDPCMSGIREEPEYATIVERIRMDIRKQRAAVDVGSL